MNNRIVKIALLLTTMVGFGSLFAQEYPVYNQYHFNYYLANPAVAGANDCHYFMLTHKQQWTGISDAPYTTTVSYQGRFKHNIGLGMYIYNDKNGYSKQQAGQLSFAYHIPMDAGNRYIKKSSHERQLSFAASIKLYDYSFDADEFKALKNEDPAIADLGSETAFNANFGAYYTSYGFFAGLTLTNLSRMKMPTYNDDMEPDMPLTGLLLVGNEFEIDRDESIEPSLMLKATSASEYAMDINAKYSRTLNDEHSYWIQLTYRQNFDDGAYQAINLMPMVGFQVKKWHFAYAYDIDLNRLVRYNYGTHELMLGYTFCYTSRFCR